MSLSENIYTYHVINTFSRNWENRKKNEHKLKGPDIVVPIVLLKRQVLSSQ